MVHPSDRRADYIIAGQNLVEKKFERDMEKFAQKKAIAEKQAICRKIKENEKWANAEKNYWYAKENYGAEAKRQNERYEAIAAQQALVSSTSIALARRRANSARANRGHCGNRGTKSAPMGGYYYGTTGATGATARNNWDNQNWNNNQYYGGY